MKKFKIKYINPETGDWNEAIKSYEDYAGIPAIEWANDFGYSMADKGIFEVEEVE